MPAKVEKLNEKADGFAEGQGTAEDMINAAKASISSELKTAQKLDIYEKATEDLDWAAAAKACDQNPKEVIGASVRGDYAVVVTEDPEDGRTSKHACLLKDVKGTSKAKSKAKSKSDS